MSLRAHLGEIARLADRLGMGGKVKADVILVSIIGFRAGEHCRAGFLVAEMCRE